MRAIHVSACCASSWHFEPWWPWELRLLKFFIIIVIIIISLWWTDMPWKAVCSGLIAWCALWCAESVGRVQGSWWADLLLQQRHQEVQLGKTWWTEVQHGGNVSWWCSLGGMNSGRLFFSVVRVTPILHQVCNQLRKMCHYNSGFAEAVQPGKVYHDNWFLQKLYSQEKYTTTTGFAEAVQPEKHVPLQLWFCGSCKTKKNVPTLTLVLQKLYSLEKCATSTLDLQKLQPGKVYHHNIGFAEAVQFGKVYYHNFGFTKVVEPGKSVPPLL